MMADLALWLVPGAPLALALALSFRGVRQAITRLAPWGVLPALAVAGLLPAGTEATFDWVLFGLRLGVDGPARALLLATGLLWLLAGGHAVRKYAGSPETRRFFAFFLLTAAGNLGFLVALDAATLYLFYALMSLAAYGLVVFGGGIGRRRAGGVYIGFAVLGEVLVLFGLLGLVHGAEGIELPLAYREAPPSWAVWLVLAGFGTKAGLFPLHGSLPISYRVLSPAVGAVMAGAMLHAGLFGWMRLLPPAPFAAPALGPLLIGAGLAGAGLGILLGLIQRDARPLIAYSSLSQMGWMLVLLGAGYATPDGARPVLLLVTVYAVHHALAKGALFLGIDALDASRNRAIKLAAMALPALSIAAFPGTSGQLAKAGLKSALQTLPEGLSDWFAWLLSVGAVGTALLMLRMLWLLWHASERQAGHPAESPAFITWGTLLAAGITVPWLVALSLAPGIARFDVDSLWASLWPLGIAALIGIWVGRQRPRFLTRWSGSIPPGDALAPLLKVVASWRRQLARSTNVGTHGPPHDQETPLARSGPRARNEEAALRRWQTAGLLFLLLVLLGLTLLWLPLVG